MGTYFSCALTYIQPIHALPHSIPQVEKKWITYQLVFSLKLCHKQGVCHGDVKIDNVLLTSWNWLFLADFASFKPTYLPEDNPAAFSFFFDTSGRRTCSIAPERFYAPSSQGLGGWAGWNARFRLNPRPTIPFFSGQTGQTATSASKAR